MPPKLLVLILLFIASTGRKLDITKPGYKPAKKLTVIPNKARNKKREGFSIRFKESCFCIRLLIKGNAIQASKKPLNNEDRVITAVSFKSCFKICERVLPSTFLTPISFARFTD